MRRRQTILLELLVAALAMLHVAGSCDRTRIEGALHPRELSAEPGETLRIEMQIRPEQSERTHKEYWTLEPASLGVLYFEPEPGRARSAFFQALRPGRGTVSGHAFYRPQTSPQVVAAVHVVVNAGSGSMRYQAPPAPFCTRFSAALPSCFCDAAPDGGMLLELGTVVVDAAAAQALVSSQREAIVRALAKVDDEAEKTTGAQITCAEIAPGFHNCLLPGGRLLATVSSYGEVYRTGCGV